MGEECIRDGQRQQIVYLTYTEDKGMLQGKGEKNKGHWMSFETDTIQ